MESINPIIIWLIVAGPFGPAVIVTAVVWHHITRPVLYFFTALLCLFGLEALLAQALEFIAIGGSLRNVLSPATRLTVIVVNNFVLGSLFLWWLGHLFRRA